MSVFIASDKKEMLLNKGKEGTSHGEGLLGNRLYKC
jgi:hypothetical protein